MLVAAMQEFASGGLDGTSTDAIARRAGISQPYLFRLFPTKKALFLAAVQRTFHQTDQLFRDAAESLAGEQAKQAMGEAYSAQLAGSSPYLQMQLQAYATSVVDREVRDLTRRAFARLWSTVVEVSGAGDEQVQAFFAHGMLMNVTSAFGIGPGCEDDDDLGRRLMAEPAAFQASVDVSPRSA